MYFFVAAVFWTNPIGKEYLFVPMICSFDCDNASGSIRSCHCQGRGHWISLHADSIRLHLRYYYGTSSIGHFPVKWSRRMARRLLVAMYRLSRTASYPNRRRSMVSPSSRGSKICRWPDSSQMYASMGECIRELEIVTERRWVSIFNRVDFFSISFNILWK